VHPSHFAHLNKFVLLLAVLLISALPSSYCQADQRHPAYVLLATGTGPATINTEAAVAEDAVTAESWVKSLASSSQRERNRAAGQLQNSGPASFPALVAALSSRDREVYQRASLIVQGFLRHEDPDLASAMRQILQQSQLSTNQQLVARTAMLLERHRGWLKSALERAGATVQADDQGYALSINFERQVVSSDNLRLLSELERLEELDVRFTPINDTNLRSIAKLKRLRKLNLQGTRITDTGLEFLSDLNEIESLSLERTAVTDEGLRFLSHMQQLSTLYLGGSAVRGSGLVHLQHLPKLNYLSFQYSDLNDADVAHLIKLQHLTTLGLDDTKITSRCLPLLAECKSLRELWLNKAPIGDEALEDLKKMSHLKALHLNGTKLSPDALYELSRALPETTIDPTPPKQRRPLPGQLPGLVPPSSQNDELADDSARLRLKAKLPAR
jgi:hypothetical protein